MVERLSLWGVEWVGGEKLGLKLNSAQLGLEAWTELGNDRRWLPYFGRANC